jgi:hypothetical protein
MEAFALRFLWSATAAGFLSFAVFDNCFHPHSCQGFVTVGLLDNILNFRKLLLTIVSDPMKLRIRAMTENGWCKESKSEPATLILVTGGESGG